MSLFANENHRFLFEEKLSTLEKGQQKNPEYISTVYIITSNPELYAKMNPYFDSGGFSVEELLNERDFSSGQYSLVLLASNLFNSGREVSPLDLISTLSQENFQIAMNAIYIRKTGAV